MTTDGPVVLCQGLTKIFKDFWLRDRARAVDTISFDVRRGEVFGLLGPNGSGKSTTIKIILGLLRKTTGRIAVFGRAPDDVAIKKRIGYLPEESYLYPFLNARETLDYYAKLFKLDHRTRRRRTDELLEMVGLEAVQYRQVREYSKGMQRRIGIAQALINDPELLILDEPTTGLDPIGNRQVKDLLNALAKRGKTIILSSHLLSDVEECVDRMVILYGGKIRAEGTCDALLESRDRVTLETENIDAATLADINNVLAKHAKAHAHVSHPRQRLEDYFIELVEKAQAERVATSGAQHGGATAAFLLGQETGDQLISSLMSSQSVESAAMPVQEAPKPSAPKGLDRAVLEQLTGGGEAAPAKPSPGTVSARSAAPSAPPAEVDRGLIGSLLDDAGGPKQPGKDAKGGS